MEQCGRLATTFPSILGIARSLRKALAVKDQAWNVNKLNIMKVVCAQ